MSRRLNYLILLTLFLNLCEVVHAQKKKQTPPPRPDDIELGWQQSVKTNFTKYSLSKRLSFYPFNKAAQIQLVSFGLKMDSIQRKNGEYYGLPIANDTIHFSRLDQRKSLTISEIDSLSDLLYNTCSRWKYYESTRIGCYNPRNAILFFDTTGKVFEYIEICFECRGFKASNKNVNAMEECDPFYEEAQAYFNRLGLETSYLPIKIPPPPPVDNQ